MVEVFNYDVYMRGGPKYAQLRIVFIKFVFYACVGVQRVVVEVARMNYSLQSLKKRPEQGYLF